MKHSRVYYLCGIKIKGDREDKNSVPLSSEKKEQRGQKIRPPVLLKRRRRGLHDI